MKSLLFLTFDTAQYCIRSMDLRKHLLDRNLKWNWDEIAKYCLRNPKDVRQIVEYCRDENEHVTKNAGAVIGKLIDYDKSILDPYLEELVKILHENRHDAVKRGITRVFQYASCPEESEGDLFDWVISALQSMEEAVAVKAFGMTAARKICEKYPELAGEMIPLLEMIIYENPSAGLENRAKKELKKLLKLQQA